MFLDPAGPCFDGYPDSQRLCRDDANYVDAIHTSMTLGFTSDIGHADFYPNWGSVQPGCFENINEIFGLNKARASFFDFKLCDRKLDRSLLRESVDK